MLNSTNAVFNIAIFRQDLPRKGSFQKVGHGNCTLNFIWEEMVFCYWNCYSDREKLLKFDAEGWEFEIFCKQNAFLTCSWGFLISNVSEQL